MELAYDCRGSTNFHGSAISSASPKLVMYHLKNLLYFIDRFVDQAM